jgi:hypothetical protein
MRTKKWILDLSGRAGEFYVAAELSKRAIPNALLTKNFADEDLMIGSKDGSKFGYIQVKSFHPDRADSFRLKDKHEQWVNSAENQFVVLVSLGSVKRNENPRYWIATRREVGKACLTHPCHGTKNWERRLFPDHQNSRLRLNPEWENRWALFEQYRES